MTRDEVLEATSPSYPAMDQGRGSHNLRGDTFTRLNFCYAADPQLAPHNHYASVRRYGPPSIGHEVLTLHPNKMPRWASVESQRTRTILYDHLNRHHKPGKSSQHSFDVCLPYAGDEIRRKWFSSPPVNRNSAAVASERLSVIAAKSVIYYCNTESYRLLCAQPAWQQVPLPAHSNRVS